MMDLQDKTAREYLNFINDYCYRQSRRVKRIRALGERLALALERQPLPEGACFCVASVYPYAVRYHEGEGPAPDHPQYARVDVELVHPWDYNDNEEHPEVLAEIMEFFRCIFKDPEPSWTKKEYEWKWLPKSVYEGRGRWDVMPIVVHFTAPWPPRGCEIEQVPGVITQVTCGKGR